MADRQGPLHELHEAAGAKLVAFGGWLMPVAYPAGTIEEHFACRRHCALFDVSHLGTVRVDAPDGFERLQSCFTNDLRRIGPGRAQYTHLLADDGSVLDDMIVWWRPDGTTFDVMPNAANTDRVTAAVGGVDVTDERAVLAVQGPQARSVVAAALGEAVGQVRRFGVDVVDTAHGSLTVAGTGYTGEDGVELAVPVDAAPAVWEALLAAGATPAGLGARDTLRLEAGLPLPGHELGPGITPLQAGLGWVVRFDAGRDFPGRAALEAEMVVGVSRRLRGVRCAGRRPPRADQPVLVDGRAAGVITSGNFSPLLACGIGLALLEPDIADGTAVTIDARGSSIDAELVALPFLSR